MLVLAPLLAFVRADFNVSYTQLALALTVFNVVSGVLADAGRICGRPGRRPRCSDRGLALSSIAFAIAGLFDSYWVFIAMYGVAGLGNTAYHPADYSLLSHHSPSERIEPGLFLPHLRRHARLGHRAGHAAHDADILRLARRLSGRCALGFVVLAALIAQPEPIAEIPACGQKLAKGAATGSAAGTGWRLLLTPAILLNLASSP